MIDWLKFPLHQIVTDEMMKEVVEEAVVPLEEGQAAVDLETDTAVSTRESAVVVTEEAGRVAGLQPEAPETAVS